VVENCNGRDRMTTNFVGFSWSKLRLTVVSNCDLNRTLS
jgi:hypothetical protein